MAQTTRDWPRRRSLAAKIGRDGVLRHVKGGPDGGEYVEHSGFGEIGDDGSQRGTRDGEDVVQAGGADGGEAISRLEHDLAGDISDGASDRGDGEAVEFADRGIASENQHGPAPERRRELRPNDAALLDSGHDCLSLPI